MVKKAILRKEIEDLKKVPICNRTQEQHSKLIKSFKGSKNYIDSILKEVLHQINSVKNWSDTCQFKKELKSRIINMNNYALCEVEE